MLNANECLYRILHFHIIPTQISTQISLSEKYEIGLAKVAVEYVIIVRPLQNVLMSKLQNLSVQIVKCICPEPKNQRCMSLVVFVCFPIWDRKISR